MRADSGVKLLLCIELEFKAKQKKTHFLNALLTGRGDVKVLLKG